MEPTTLTLHTQFGLGPVDPRLFGGFLEHMGCAIYEGVYDPASPLADADERRADRDIVALAEAVLLTVPDAQSANTFEQPNVVQPRPFDAVTFSAGQATLSLPPLSLAALTFRLA